jgi:hypothetical protein
MDEVEQREDAFLLDPGLGPAMYLCADGQILHDGRDWDDQPMREATEDEAISALVVGAKKIRIPELLELLPPSPPGSAPCARCHGLRWLRLHPGGVEPADSTTGNVICFDCSGRGWSLSAQQS